MARKKLTKEETAAKHLAAVKRHFKPNKVLQKFIDDHGYSDRPEVVGLMFLDILRKRTKRKKKAA